MPKRKQDVEYDLTLDEDNGATPEIFTVSELNNTVRDLLEETFMSIWVEGEISNFAAPQSGHWYFSLKDASAQVRCAMFRGQQRQVGFTPKEGMHVLVRARVSLYPNRGDYQLIVDHMEERGEGKLQRAFEQLKKKLSSAGLFDEKHKKPLPFLPDSIGIVTSPTGAALRDILTVLQRRYPCAAIIVYPTLVQGKEAATHIANAIKTANRRNECDVLIVGRGGGSLEDLWPFNEEVVAYAIHDSTIPIISAVGHEIDFTIADFVADVRAPTPSAAAEIVAPHQEDLLKELKQARTRLTKLLKSHIDSYKNKLSWMTKHIQQQHPKRQLAEKMQKLDFCELTLVRLHAKRIAAHQNTLHTLYARLQRKQPTTLIKEQLHHLALSMEVLHSNMNERLAHHKNKLAQHASTLDAMSPLATLKRGYAIATTRTNTVISNVAQVNRGDAITVTINTGALDCIIEDIKQR